MCNGEGESAIEKRQPLGAKRGVRTKSVRAIAIQQKRCVAVRNEAFTVSERDGYPNAVVSRCEEPFRCVCSRVVARHRSLFQKRSLAANHVVFENRIGRDQRGVSEPQGVRFKHFVMRAPQCECRLIETDVVRGSGCNIVNANTWQTLIALKDCQEDLKRLYGFQCDTGARRQNLTR